MEDPRDRKIKELENNIRELEAKLKSQDLLVRYYREVIRIASRHLPFDLDNYLKKSKNLKP